MEWTDYAAEHTAIEEQLKSLGLPLPDSDCMPTTAELSDVMVNEIRRLRLTDAEREAIEEAIRRLWGFDIAATLRGLLERTN